MPSYKSNTGNGYALILTLTLMSQDVPGNKSTVRWKLDLEKGHTYYNARHTANLTVGGKLVWNVSNVTFNAAPSRSTMELASGTEVYEHTSNGTLGITFAANLRTVTQGQSWSVPPLALEGLYSLPRIVRLPGRPAAPSVSQNESTRVITVTIPTPSSPSPITGYQVRVLDDIDHTWRTHTANLSTRQYIFTPPRPLTAFNFQGRALTQAGSGEWSPTTSVVGVGSGPYVRVSGVWRKTNAYVKMGGVWVPVLCFTKSGSTWRNVGR